MTKQDFLTMIENDSPFLAEYRVIVDRLSMSSNVLGCYQENGNWKVYATSDKGKVSIYKVTTKEEEAFEYLSRMIKKKTDILKKSYGF